MILAGKSGGLSIGLGSEQRSGQAAPQVLGSFADSFVRADGSSLGPNWVEDENHFHIVSDSAESFGSDASFAHVSGISWTNAEVSVDVVGDSNPGGGVVSRFDGLTISGYRAFATDFGGGNWLVQLERLDAGSPTSLGANVFSGAAIPTLSLKVVASDITVLLDGAVCFDVSDGTYSGPGEVGILATSPTQQLKNFVAQQLP